MIEAQLLDAEVKSWSMSWSNSLGVKLDSLTTPEKSERCSSGMSSPVTVILVEVSMSAACVSLSTEKMPALAIRRSASLESAIAFLMRALSVP
jgi:hypothetical protein